MTNISYISSSHLQSIKLCSFINSYQQQTIRKYVLITHFTLPFHGYPAHFLPYKLLQYLPIIGEIKVHILSPKLTIS